MPILPPWFAGDRAGAHMAAAGLPPTGSVVKIDAEEFARLEAEASERARAEREERSERDVVDRAWREQEEYTRAVAELKKKMARRKRIPVIAGVLFLGVAAIAAVMYSHQVAEERASRAEALRIASESVARQEEENRAEERRAQAVPAAQPAADPEAIARAPRLMRRRRRRTGPRRWR